MRALQWCSVQPSTERINFFCSMMQCHPSAHCLPCKQWGRRNLLSYRWLDQRRMDYCTCGALLFENVFIYLFIHSALYTSRKLCCDASGCHQLTYVCLSLRSGLASWLNVSPRHVCILIWINLNCPHDCEEEFTQLLRLIWGSSEKILNIVPYMV